MLARVFLFSLLPACLPESFLLSFSFSLFFGGRRAPLIIESIHPYELSLNGRLDMRLGFCTLTYGDGRLPLLTSRPSTLCVVDRIKIIFSARHPLAAGCRVTADAAKLMKLQDMQIGPNHRQTLIQLPPQTTMKRNIECCSPSN
ncbi:unnamed protein product [Periconia digitata]|uniref:Secreted protein n=1 Tax=Periconia digitata TaxID=1303443 RepID=A0A9W4UV82_9PLEO|nr:unnamed protein product [Periconia digitata]